MDKEATKKCAYCNVLIREDKVKRHSNVCDAKKLVDAMQLLPFYKEDTNVLCNSSLSQDCHGNTCEFNIDHEKLFDRIKHLYIEHIGEIQCIKESVDECKSLFEIQRGGENRTNESQRHREQEGSIVYHMQQNNLLNNVDTFIELGAGKGMLSSAIALARSDAVYICVERSAYKTKAENYLRNHFRARVDLKHVELFSLLQSCGDCSDGMKINNHNTNRKDKKKKQRNDDNVVVSEESASLVNDAAIVSVSSTAIINENQSVSPKTAVKAVCVGKHLCGCATDYALMAMRKLSERIHLEQVDSVLLVDGVNDTSSCSTDERSSGNNYSTIKDLTVPERNSGSAYINNSTSNNNQMNLNTTNSTIQPHLSGFAIATCCHASCTYTDSAAYDFLYNVCKISETEFDVMRKWCGLFTLDKQQKQLDIDMQQQHETDVVNSGGTDEGNGNGNNDNSSAVASQIGMVSNINDSVDSTTIDVTTGNTTDTSQSGTKHRIYLNRTYTERALVGRYCKRLIDYGRLQFIKKHTELKVDMVYYVDEDTSPENCLIIGYA